MVALMAEGGIPSRKESLWAAGVAAFAAHSLVISALALGITCSGGRTQRFVQNSFRVEMVLAHEEQNDWREEGPLRKSQATAMAVASRSVSFKTPVKTPLEDSFEKSKPKKPREKKQAFPSRPAMPQSTQALAPSQGVSDPFPVYNPPPVYPLEARRRKVQGIVLLKLSLTETGEVSKATPLSPRAPSILEEAALAAIHQWRFRPGVRTVEVPIEFKMRQARS